MEPMQLLVEVLNQQTQLIEGVDESQDTPDNQDASVEEASQVEALEEEIERSPGGRNEEGTEVLDIADAEPVHVVTPDHANKNQEVSEVPNIDAPPISIHDSHNYRRLPFTWFGVRISIKSERKTKFVIFEKFRLNKLSEVNGSGISVVTLHDRKKILMTEETTEEEGRDDPELQNEYNLTFFKCSSTSWLMTNC
ncbi:hypothetical protein DAPPUDRAFT_120425 [Daphnia pulex]|uniref:Uncharacterized protein n=1 Tax=Daphnia pulex TaxID=6669 RepID=E9I1C2_DAPPU|nr:hypothetical protein DAPPUDRAFT_120425 [Daphnia pulex]|eukprot:EFX62208.1 hypothetical protein DAPPUDRAFT_120425 [Daphnia pulex]